MKEVPKKDETEVSGGVVSGTGFRNGLVIPGMPIGPYPIGPVYPTEPCIPMPEDPLKYVEK
ncbi:MAG: hypothetical protein JJE39_10040 [Vicinamibacteria bacterium]|nr:hypothetical protein [Vicinamibacteria bacterium]